MNRESMGTKIIVFIGTIAATWFATMAVSSAMDQAAKRERAQDRELFLRLKIMRDCENGPFAARVVKEMRGAGESLTIRELGLIYAMVTHEDKNARLSAVVAAVKSAQEAKHATLGPEEYAMERNEAETEWEYAQR